MYAFTSMGVVVISTIVFILSTMPQLTDEIDMILFQNSTENANDENMDNAIIPMQPVERWENVMIKFL